MALSWFSYALFLTLLSVAAAAVGQESVEFLTLYPSNAQKASPNVDSLASSVHSEHLEEVSSSVLAAELWLRSHVLAHYPANKITHIVVGHNILCAHEHQDKHGVILPCLKNIYYSLTRWGLEREIKVSTSFSSHCIDSKSGFYKEGLYQELIAQVAMFIESTNSSYLVNPPNVRVSADELAELASVHLESIKKIGLLGVKPINFVRNSKKEAKPVSRKLFVVSTEDSKVVDPYPARPSPLPEISPSSSIHISAPARIANPPLPPLIGPMSPTPLSLPHAPTPRHSPVTFPAAPPPYGIHLPPCNPSPPVDFSSPPNPVVSAPSPDEGGTGGVLGGEKLWCVAKPSVPADKLEEAMNYACGEGGADCEVIQPNGNCYYPDSMVAHASFAYNSYWQKTKRNSGTCSFGGTAMLINADPSFVHCKFVVV